MSDLMSEQGCHNCNKESFCTNSEITSIGWCAGWQSNVGISFIDKTKDALPKEKKFSLDKMIDDHWEYINDLLITHASGGGPTISGEDGNVIRLCGFHYKSAFRHGWKHALEHYGIEEKSDE